MTPHVVAQRQLPRGYVSATTLDIEEFDNLCSTETRIEDYPLATEVLHRVPVYSGALVRDRAAETDPAGAGRRELFTEWASCFAGGPGLLVVRDAFGDLAVLKEMTSALDEVVDEERRAGALVSDHYAAAGSNTRVWNVPQKVALRFPSLFCRYFSNPVLAMAAEAWLGPWYQYTAQVNVVHPGGQAQHPHRDYHLGFLTNEQAERFPAHVHLLSQALTLQVVIAHSEMPVESGPTMVLPYSHNYLPGYVAWRDARFSDYFAAHAVQFHLHPGDIVFLNPGVHHAAGTNRTVDQHRWGNLLQISSAFGVAMENTDHYAMAESIFPWLVSLSASGQLSRSDVERAIAANAGGYPFPTNLDTDPPSGGLMSNSLAALTTQAVTEGWDAARFRDLIHRQRERRRP